MKARAARLIDLILAGSTKAAIAETRRLLRSGAGAETLLIEGIDRAVRRMDQKCAVEQFDLLDILLAGRAVKSVLATLFPSGNPPSRRGATIVLATMQGDLHDLGKNLVKMVLEARGFQVIDAGVNCPPTKLIDAARDSNPLAIGVSGLLTSSIPAVKALRPLLRKAGLGDIRILAGGAALKQATAAMLDVDFVAESVFDGVRFLERMLGGGAPHTPGRRLTPIENILATLRMEPTEKPPVIGLIFGHAAGRGGVSLMEYRRGGEALAVSQLAALQAYRHDAVFAVMDSNVEAEALGVELDTPSDAYANIVRRPQVFGGSFFQRPIPQPDRSGRMPEALLALRILREKTRDRVLVCGCTTGPMTLATQLLGLEEALFMARDEPRKLARLLDYCVSVAGAFGIAQLRAGAHVILVADPSSSTAVIPPALFTSVCLPRLKKLFSAFEREGALANWLGVFGPCTSILARFPDTGATLVQIDHSIPAPTARAALPHTCLGGNLTPLSFVESSPQEIAEHVNILRETIGAGGGWIVSSGGEIPPESRPENIAAMVQAIHGAG